MSCRSCGHDEAHHIPGHPLPKVGVCVDYAGDIETVELLIAAAIAYRAGHVAALDSHHKQAESVLTALHHNGYQIVKAT